MVFTHGNFGTMYINPMVHEQLNDKIKNNDLFSLPVIKRGKSMSRSNYGKSFGSMSRKGGSVNNIKRNAERGSKMKRKLRKGLIEGGGEKMYPYSLFEKIMNVSKI